MATPDRSPAPAGPPRIGFVSLGCPKATVDQACMTFTDIRAFLNQVTENPNKDAVLPHRDDPSVDV